MNTCKKKGEEQVEKTENNKKIKKRNEKCIAKDRR